MTIRLPSLTEAIINDATETAQRYLASAYDSVEAVLRNLDVVREQRRAAGQDLRGRLTENEEDLLRAAIVFAGAGLDATLKQLIRDSLPSVLEVSDLADGKFSAFIKTHISQADVVDVSRLAAYLASRSPRAELIEAYIADLTGGSLQSKQQVEAVAGALGVDDADLRRRVAGLRTAFQARNQIAHELDLRSPERHGDRARRTRKINDSVGTCHELLESAQLLINAVTGVVGGDG